MQAELVQRHGARIEGVHSDIGRVQRRACKERGDAGCPRLQRVRGLGVVVFEQEIADAVVEGVIETAFALEGVALADGAVLEEQLDDVVVAAEARSTAGSRICRPH